VTSSGARVAGDMADDVVVLGVDTHLDFHVLEKGNPATRLRRRATSFSREEAAVPPKGNC
jgi:hypothetical protein